MLQQSFLLVLLRAFIFEPWTFVIISLSKREENSDKTIHNNFLQFSVIIDSTFFILDSRGNQTRRASVQFFKSLCYLLKKQLLEPFSFWQYVFLSFSVLKDMDVQTDKYVLLYSLYSYPNVILCFFGGFLLDRVFGVR